MAKKTPRADLPRHLPGDAPTDAPAASGSGAVAGASDAAVSLSQEALREQIDRIDTHLRDLLQARAAVQMHLTLQGQSGTQGQSGAQGQPVAHEPASGAQAGRNAMRELAAEPLSDAAVDAVFVEIESACRELVRPMRVAYLGPEGTFSELAVRRHFGAAVTAVPCASFDEVFRAVEAGTADSGVVAVENSTEGAVNRTLDLFLQSPLIIGAEVLVPVEHCLMNLSGSLDEVTSVCAHPQALAQCAQWLSAHLPHAALVSVASNAEGARLAASDASVAGIAAASAAQRYDLQISRRAIQDNPGNRTRFAVIGQTRSGPTGKDQTTLILSVPDEAGAVHRLIEPLARHGVSMKRFESRPARQRGWEYFFYIDVLGHAEEPAVRAALAEIRRQTTFYKEVGSYPRSS